MSSAATGLTGSKYVSFTTFRRDGTPVATPVWLVQLDDGRVGFWTSSKAGKAKRLAHTDRVMLQTSDARGKALEGSAPVEATAELVATGAAYDEVVTKIKQKYGFMTKITHLLSAVGHIGKGDYPYGDVAVVVTLPSPDTTP